MPLHHRHRPASRADVVHFARALVKRYGADAYDTASSYAINARDRGNLRRMQHWRRVAACVRELDK